MTGRIRTTPLSSQETQDLERFHHLLKQRERDFVAADFRAVFLKPENHTEWKLHMVVVDFTRDSHEPPNQIFSYDSLRLATVRVSVADAADAIDRLAREGLVDLDGMEWTLEGSFRLETWFVPGVVPSHAYLGGEWPVAVFECHTNAQNYSLPRGPFLKPDLPPFSDFFDAASYLVGFSRDDSRLQQPTAWVRVPDYRGRVEELRLSKGSALVRVGTGASELAELLGKVTVDGPEGRARKDADVSTGEASFDIPVPCTRLEFYLLHLPSAELIDYRLVSLDYPGRERDPTVHIEAGPGDVEAWLQTGENEWTEFKSGLKDDDLLETVVSFANGEGGRILVGIDDNARPIGLSDDKTVQRVESVVQARVDPVPRIEARFVDFNSKPILVIDVPPGANPPYTLRERGVFIRSGSSDRIPTRAELDGLYKRGEPRVI